MSAIQSKRDVDRIRQRAGSKNRLKLDQIQAVIREYATGATPAASMLKIIRIMKGEAA